MKILHRFLLIFTLTGLLSCSDDFVNVENPGALAPSQYPSTVAELEQLLTGVYGTQHATGLYGHTMLGKNLWLWDHTLDLSWQGTPTWIQMGQNNSQPNDSFLYDTWRELWRGVQRSNTLLAGIETYRQKAPNDAATIDVIKGQALFLRAWYYFHLVSFWGEGFNAATDGAKMGVPIITEVASGLDETQVPRKTVKEGWDFIIADLKAAEGLLKNTNWTGATDKHKVSGWAVKGFLGKVYTYQADWANAKTYLADVVNNSGKSLVSFDVYKDMFNGKNEFTSESLFELNLNVDMTARGGDDQSMGSSIGMVIAPTYVNDNGGQAASAWSNVFPHAKNIARFGFNEGHYFKPGTTSANIANVDPAYITRSLEAKKKQTVDPRLWVACYQPYVDSMVVNGRKRPISHYLDITELDMEAWSFRKFTNPNGTEAEINMSNGANFPWLRLADVYLLYAETLAKSGDNAGALEYINKVKRRAYGLPVNTPSAMDYKSLTDQTKATDAVLKNDPLKYERWAELFAEGHWWLDVRRWQIGDKEAAYYQRIRGGAIQWDPTDYAQPIPINEITANVNMRQNPGY
ncbi:RagB/SusD family nutrient uptake outer membrane protein [Dyadobacter fermentans]|uniref:RagB/SusD domain protein n=1 Tax=Dyadobacter fermentans (strain ATCC 700827 / DSM 18053 / CIP 107007 / KCTC 52180 / NS114) TaxID=471854 RepID=C6W717_DYAFD|nr:RagB/SusD family nutrient uptake outer membrane protein [Dyadobacter fermentans]ACT92626.1 RagB/SusD domain protein [Dyadobacter fermentans DSM 18053]